MKIKSKEQIIEHFTSGNKDNQFIGVENEKFLFKKKIIQGQSILIY